MFEPWVGTQWGQSDNVLGGRRLMVLGESHYGSKENPEHVGKCFPSMTKQVVEDEALKGRHRFFTNLTHLIAGKPKSAMSPEELRSVWESIIFYNYVPVIVATTPGVAPTDEMFAAGREPFLRLLDEHQPEAIIVCGHRLWRPMYLGLPHGLQDDAKGEPFRRIGLAIAARMRHPSRFFNAREQHEAVTQELFRRIDAARAQRAA